MSLRRYLIHGGELFQTQEAVRSVQDYCAQNGYTKYEILEIASSTSLSDVRAALQEIDMFAEKKLVEVRLNVTLNKNDQIIFEKVLDLQTEDVIILVVAKKLTTDTLKQNWVKKITQTGEVIEVKSIPSYQWPSWVTKRLTSLNIQATQDACELLIKSYEGNLVDLNQSLLQIKANHPNTLLTFEICQQYVQEKNILSVFDLASAVLSSDLSRIQLIINSLQTNQVEPSLILWSLTKELRLLLKLALEFNQQANISDDHLVKKYNIWPSNLNKYKKILKNNSLVQLAKLINLAWKIDLTIKGVEVGNVFELLCTLCFKLVNGNINIVISEG